MEPLRELSTWMTDHAPAAGGSWRNETFGLKFGSARHVPVPVRLLYEPVFALVVQGAKRLVVGEEMFSCGRGTFLVVSVDLPITCAISEATPAEPYLALAMTLQPAAIASLLVDAASVDRAPSFTETAGMGVSHATRDLLEAVVRLVRLLDRPRDLPVLGPLAHKEILWHLLCSEQGPRLRQIGLADSRLSQIGLAMRRMRESYREPLPIEELARLSAMSVTSFHRHFRAVAMMSPLQYLKQIRLLEARTRLLAHDGDVASIGYAVGYESPSQFSREYKRAYGAPPAEDARLLRAASRGNAPQLTK